MSATQLVGIYELFRLGRKQGGGFDLNHKTKDRDLHPVHHSFAEDSNSNSQINGLLYVEDKEATKNYWDKKPYDKEVKVFTPFVEVPKEPKKELSPEIQEVHNKLSEMSKEQLIEFAEKNEYKVTKTKKAENILLELIEQIEVNE
jgi:hypothetical protein